ncbi:hypothetical protein [Treponema bryantii]|uniref:hypothetical protein n=1 Tax=Treponema bryantii TaxID=163 RepID=UPI0003B7B042|nr:hypothetical protein [Treponema bryantii]
MAQIFNQAFEQKLIYVYRINDTAHEGFLKIGEASCNAGMAYFAFETQVEAENCMKYIKTKFARAMLGTLKVTQDNPRETWLNVPIQDFTATSDINWNKSIPEIDKQLYKKYGLSADEVEFIESKVREM